MTTSATGSWISSIKATVEFYEMDKDLIVRDALQRFEEDGKNAALWYWTWEAGDKERGLCTLLVCENIPPAIYITFPEEEIINAALWIRAENPHIEFSKEKPFVGFNNDDFVYNRATAKLHFTLKEHA